MDRSGYLQQRPNLVHAHVRKVLGLGCPGLDDDGRQPLEYGVVGDLGWDGVMDSFGLAE